MPIITLTTDLGLKDYYVASIKAAILSQCPQATIVDISHDISKFDILQTAFTIANVHNDFPPGTIHIIGVMPDASPQTPHIAVFYKKQYFIGADNGIFSLIFDRKPEQIVELSISPENDSLTFQVKDIFVKAACHLARGGKLEVIGKAKKDVFQRSGFKAVVNENSIRGTAIYIDDFGNVVTNITEQLFRETVKGRPFSIAFRRGGHNIESINNNYNEVPAGERLALFGTTGLLEIAINTGNASELLGIKLNDIVRVDF